MKKSAKAKTKRFKRKPAAMAAIVLALTFCSVTVFASEDSEIIKLTKRKTSDNVAFSVSNMFPGDTEEKNYCVSVTYEDEAALYFQATVRDGYEKLAEVLQMSVAEVSDDGTETIIYEGLIGGMDEPYVHLLSSSGKTTDEVYYEITVRLDTGVGNEYENLSLVADFIWWVETEETAESEEDTESEETAGSGTTEAEDEDNEESARTTGTSGDAGEDSDADSSAKTGDIGRVGMWTAVFMCAVIGLAVLIAIRSHGRRRDGDA